MRFSLKAVLAAPALAGAAASFALILPLAAPVLTGCSAGAGVRTGTPEYWHSRRVRPGGKKPAEPKTAQAAVSAPAVSSGEVAMYSEGDLASEPVQTQTLAAAPVTAPKHKGAAWPKAVPAYKSVPAPAAEAPAAEPPQAPVQKSAPARTASPSGGSYTVQPGDTLYSIAAASGFLFDWHYLAKKNGIKPPYAIEKGQILDISDDCGGCRVHVVKSGETLYSTAFLYHTTVGRLAALNGFSVQTKLNAGQNIIVSEGKSSGWPSAKPGRTGSGSSSGRGSSAGSSKPVRTADDTPAPVASRSGISWHWPATGKVVRGFSVAENGNKGIDISGKRGAPVKAAAAGTVVYAGNALRGYGNLIIIKHSDDYLSAYAHNDSIKVREQQKVKAGQLIAGMGSTDSDSVLLHFEIRYRGKSQNPASYLPKSRN